LIFSIFVLPPETVEQYELAAMCDMQSSSNSGAAVANALLSTAHLPAHDSLCRMRNTPISTMFEDIVSRYV
jgi:hypothetical protein